ncbi:MAG: hypothetical protein M1118_12570 [Chloroflexi bacterium]|nr:hypothetical protein [Chloroflexota bacterium]
MSTLPNDDSASSPEAEAGPAGQLPPENAQLVAASNHAPHQQREGGELSAAEAALQITLKWMDHASDAAELALSDQELAEAQAQSITTFFENVLSTLVLHFPAKRQE